MLDRMSFVVYEKKRGKKYASIHEATCGYVRMHGGELRNPRAGIYHDGIPTLAEARSIAERTGLPLEVCHFCNRRYSLLRQLLRG